MPVADTIPERVGEKAARQLCDNLGLIPTPGTLTVILWTLDAERLAQARRDAEIAENLPAFNMDDPGSSVAKAIRTGAGLE